MSARRGALVSALVVTALVVALRAPGTVDARVALVAVVLAAVVAWVLAARAASARAARLARTVGTWLGATVHRPLVPEGSAGWRALGSALNALGGTFHRRGDRIAAAGTLRRELVDALAQPALLFGADGHLEAANAPARATLGLAAHVGTPTAVQALGSASLAEGVGRVRELGGRVTLDVVRGGQELRATIARVGAETLVVLVDRTRELRVEELRRDFVVNASHELKTPVTAIRTIAEALAITVRGDPTRSAALVGDLEHEADRLVRLVHDLLDLRRLEEDAPTLTVAIDLAGLCRTVADDLASVASARGVTIVVDAPASAIVAGVRADLDLVVRNLVDNAVQYNRDGGRVEVQVRHADGAQVLTVRDTGIGIPQQDLARVFERFYRVDGARSRSTGGTGLGLSLVRHAVERQGGSVGIESLLGEGTTVTVRLPIEPRDRASGRGASA